MKQESDRELTRRRFLGGAIPLCAAGCLGRFAFASAPRPGTSRGLPGPSVALGGPAAHVFDEELPRALTYRQAFAMTYAHVVLIVLHLSRSLGAEAAIRTLRAYSEEQAALSGAAAAKQAGGGGLKALKSVFESPWGRHFWTMTLVRDTDRVLEVRAGECQVANLFRAGGAGGELGFAAVCHGDFAYARSFDPKLRLERDKTLMQGHDCCNHRYVLEP